MRFDGAELDAGAAVGFSGGEAGAFEVGGAEVDVGTELGFDVGLDCGSAREGARVRTEFGEQFHGYSSSDVVLRMPAMRSAMRFHFVVSVRSCLRPAAVRR